VPGVHPAKARRIAANMVQAAGAIAEDVMRGTGIAAAAFFKRPV